MFGMTLGLTGPGDPGAAAGGADGEAETPAESCAHSICSELTVRQLSSAFDPSATRAGEYAV